MAKTCSQCHRRVVDEAQFCPRCGGPVQGTPAFSIVMGMVVFAILIVLGLFFVVG